MRKVNFRILSDDKCVECGKPLKQNLINMNPNAKRCYVCNKLRSSSQNFNRKEYKDKQSKNKVAWS